MGIIFPVIEYGTNVSVRFQNPENATGPATGSTFDVVSLGEGGKATYA